MVLALVHKVWEAPRTWFALLTHFLQRWNNVLFVPKLFYSLAIHMTMDVAEMEEVYGHFVLEQ